jgi:RimJ/RimL family protein N-acetyltransferase
MPPLAEPPHHLVTERLFLRPYEPRDAPLLKEAIDSSLDHLRAFMDWAWAAPEPEGVIRARLREFRRSFERGDDWIYAIFSRDGSALLGGGGLHRRVGPEALEIGYWIRAGEIRRGYATEAAAAVTRAAFERCGAVRTEIHVDPANTGSLAVAERLGYVRDAMLRRRLPPIQPGAERRDEVIFSLLDEEYAASPAAAYAVEGFAPRRQAQRS